MFVEWSWTYMHDHANLLLDNGVHLLFHMDPCRDIGPVGCLMSSGCDVPFNGISARVDMMRRATEDYAKTNR